MLVRYAHTSDMIDVAIPDSKSIGGNIEFMGTEIVCPYIVQRQRRQAKPCGIIMSSGRTC